MLTKQKAEPTRGWDANGYLWVALAEVRQYLAVSAHVGGRLKRLLRRAVPLGECLRSQTHDTRLSWGGSHCAVRALTRLRPKLKAVPRPTTNSPELLVLHTATVCFTMF